MLSTCPKASEENYADINLQTPACCTSPPPNWRTPPEASEFEEEAKDLDKAPLMTLASFAQPLSLSVSFLSLFPTLSLGTFWKTRNWPHLSTEPQAGFQAVVSTGWLRSSSPP